MKLRPRTYKALGLSDPSMPFRRGRKIMASAVASADQRVAARDARIADLERQLAEARAELTVAPAECGPNCDDRDCPYIHSPLSLRQDRDNWKARAEEAGAGVNAPGRPESVGHPMAGALEALMFGFGTMTPAR